MDSNESRYSLVAAYENDKGLWYYRLADIDTLNNKLVEAEYRTESYDAEYEPVTLYSKSNKEPYKAVIKKWKYDIFDNRKQYIKENSTFHGKIFEIAFLDDDIENNDYNEEYVRQALYNGIYVDETVNNEFLLIVGKKDNYLVSLLCKKNKFKRKNNAIDFIYIDKNESDLMHSITSLDLYKIERDSIVSIDNLLDHPFSSNVISSNRYFYDELKLPQKKETFLVRQIDDYSINFFSKYFKMKKELYGLTNKERTKFIGILETIDQNNQELEEYFSKTGYGSSELKSAFLEVAQEVINVLHDDDEMGKLFKDYLLYDDNYYEDCLETVKKDWENSDEFKSLMADHEEQLTKSLIDIDETTKELNRIKEELKVVQNQNTILNEENKSLTEKNATINKQIETTLVNYKNDVVSLIKELAPFELFNTNAKTSEEPRRKGYIHKKNKELVSLDQFYKSEIETYEDFYDYLIDNISLFYTIDRSNDLVASIISAIANKKAIIVDEYNGEKIADSLSLLIDKRMCDKYIIPSVDIDINRLFYSLSKNENSVIYFDGVLNTYNESLLKAIVKSFSSKIFIFGVDEELVNSFSKSLWNFALYIDLGRAYTGKIDEKFHISSYDIKKFRKEIKEISKDTIEDNMLKKSKLLKDNKIQNLENILKSYATFLNCKEIPSFYINQIILNSNRNIEYLIEILPDLYSEESLIETLIANEME